MVCQPVIGNIDSPRNPDLVMRHDMIQEFDQSGKSRWPPNQPAMQPDRQHLWRRCALGIKNIKRINQILGKLIARMKPLRSGKAHIIRIQRIRNNQMRRFHLRRPEWQIIRIIIRVINKPAVFERQDCACFPTCAPYTNQAGAPRKYRLKSKSPFAYVRVLHQAACHDN